MPARKIDTTRFGAIEVPAERVFRFPEGLPGFDAVREFCLVDHPGSPAFQWLQATEVPALAFVVTNPLFFKADYKIQVRAEDLSTIELEDLSLAIVLVILVVPKDDPAKMTANLQGPIVLNAERGLGKQLVLAGNQYPIKYPVFGEKAKPQSTGASVTGHG